MTESPNNQRRRPGQSRGLRARQRSRSEGQSNQRQSSQTPRAQQAHRHRKSEAAKNGAKPGQRRKPSRPRTPHNKLDSEADFRLARPSALQQQTHGQHDDAVLFSQTQLNGHRKGKPMRNGQHWTPSDGGIYLQELRGSDWYREDQARYAAKQIALENAEQRRANGDRYQNGDSGQQRRQPPRPRTMRNPRARQGQQQTSNLTDTSAVNGDATDAAVNTTPAIQAPATLEKSATNAARVSATDKPVKSPASKPENKTPASVTPINRTNSAQTTKATTNNRVSKPASMSDAVPDDKQQVKPSKSDESASTVQATTPTKKPASKRAPKRSRTSDPKKKAVPAKTANEATVRKTAASTTQKTKTTRKATATKSTTANTKANTKKAEKDSKDKDEE